ncbi:MAG: TetR family transcriptional regulator [Actinomycetota bacterium]|nr:TetR family transcriptional regulator [Actinomycetota bacterium]
MSAGRPKALDLEEAMPLIVGMFWRGGYVGSTLDEVAAALGVTKPTLCRTLGDKEAIFAAALDAYHREHIEPAEDHLDRAATLGQALEAVFSLFVERTLDDGLPEGCFLGDNGSSGEFTTGPIATTLHALQSRLASSVQRRIEQAISDGELEPGTSPAPIVQYILGQFAALSAISRSHPTSTQLDAVVRYMLDGLPWTKSLQPDHTQIGTTMTEPNTSDVEEDVTLFKGASNNSYFPVYFNALPEPGVDKLECEKLTVDLRPERDVTLYVEIYNPQSSIPLIVTPGGMGEIDGFGGFARNVAAAAPDLKVIIWDRRNMGRSGINFGSDPLTMEEAEDLHVLIDRLGVGPATLYGMSSGARSNIVLAERYPEDIAAFVIAPLTGGPLAAEQLPQEYYLKYVNDDSLTSMEEVAKTPLWAAYVERNGAEGRAELMRQDVSEFLAAMKRAGEHLQSFAQKTTLGMTDEQLAALTVPATLILHHGQEVDYLHPIVHSRAATTLLQNSTLEFAPTLEPILELILPFVREHTPVQA